MIRLAAILAVFALSACERPKLIEVRDRGRVETALRCQKFGICYTCAPGVSFDGRLHTVCAMKASALCPGSQPGEGDLIEETYRWKSGRTEIRTRVDNAVAKGECE